MKSLGAVAFLALAIAGLGQQPSSTPLAGRQRGAPFSDGEISPQARISDIYVFNGGHICGVQLRFSFPDGRTRLSPRDGSPCGAESSFHLDADERVVGLSGRRDVYIDSLQVHTNKRTSPLFGGGGAEDYFVEVPVGNQAVGFTGRSGSYLNAIGLLYAPIPTPATGHTMLVGGAGGTDFTDSDVPPGARISEVRVRSGDGINSIQAVYTLPDGRSLQGPVHGGEGGSLNIFSLDPNEFITGFSGRSGLHINSISIRTNRRASELLGGNHGGSVFEINVPAGSEAVGFRGRASDVLDAIGLNYTTANHPRQEHHARP